MILTTQGMNLVKKMIQFFTNLFVVILALIMGPHGKRMVVLTTLYMQLSHMQRFNKEKMHELNVKLAIARNEDALEFPSLLNWSVWGKGIPAITCIEEEAAVSYLMSLTPNCLRYNRKQMSEDFKKVIQTSGAVQHAIPA